MWWQATDKKYIPSLITSMWSINKIDNKICLQASAILHNYNEESGRYVAEYRMPSRKHYQLF